MKLLGLAQEIEIEQEFVCALLDSALRQPGSAQRLAEHALISPVHLSYIRRGKRFPRLAVAKQIAQALPLPLTHQREWLCHVERVWSLKCHVRKRMWRLARDSPPDHLVARIQKAHRVATFAEEPRLAKFNYRVVKFLAENLIDSVDPNHDPINFIELAFLLNDALYILNRCDRGLWYSKRAHWLVESIDDPRPYQLAREHLDYLQINGWRMEAVALHHLQLHREALAMCEQTEALDAFKRSESLWKPPLYHDLINSITGIPRFSITRVENLAEQARRICDARAGALDPLLNLRVAIALARAYIAHANDQDAARVLHTWLVPIDRTAFIGPLPKASYYRAWALLYSARGDYGAGWKYFARRAARIASEAGLEQQLAGIRSEAGAHAEEIWHARELSLTRPIFSVIIPN